jgi:hypothetical protein
MGKHIPILPVVTLFVLIGSANAQGVDLKVCPLEDALRLIQNYSVELNARIADQEMPLMRSMEQLSEKGAAHPDRPVGESLTPAERTQFQELRFHMLQLDTQKIGISGYLRDARVISKMAEVAYATSQAHTYAENDPDFYYSTVLSFLRMQHPASELKTTTPSKPDECTIETGLHFYEQLMMHQIARLANFEEAQKRLNAISQKYKLDTKQPDWVEKIPSGTDKQTAKSNMGTLNQGFTMVNYINDLENLKALNTVALAGYWSDMDDANKAHNEEELSKMGTSFPEKAKQMGERAVFLSGLLNMIAQKVPSDAHIEIEGRTNRLREQGAIK